MSMTANTIVKAASIARSYIARGWAVIPLPPRTKIPTILEWEQLRISETDVPKHFRANSNIGVLNGEPSDWLVDVDIDLPLARELADDFLPSTGAVFGRASSRRSHRLFNVTGPVETLQRRLPKVDGKAAMIIELRSTGSQTVFPGSVHPSGERIDWDSDGEPAVVAPGLLVAAVNAIADEVVKRLGVTRRPVSRNGQPVALPADIGERARKYLGKVPPAISGQGGHDQTYHAACVVVQGFALERGPSLELLREWNQLCEPPWSDRDLEHKIDDALKEPGERGYLFNGEAPRDTERRDELGAGVVISNYSTVEVEKDGESKTVAVPMSMGDIIADINKRMGDWPRRIDNVLFVDDPEHGIDWFDRRTTAGLFGWLRRHNKVQWSKGGSFVGQAELFAEIERTAHRYEAIELLPHEPPVDGIYYRGNAPPPGDGSHLRNLLDRFRPETTIDRDLIQAGLMTAFWGGLPGCRPAFVITSDDGRGVGKSKVAEVVGYLCGGFVDVSAGEEIGALKTRLLTPDAQTKRVALLDNVKTLRFSWAELEAMITGPVISGRQLYVGEGQRPNLLTWFITLNGVSMATDMAQRSVIIKVVKGKNDGPWWEQTRQFIDQHRPQIIGDLIGALRAKPFPLAEFTRWATWEQHVLCRLPEPGEAQRLILDRQGEANCELDEVEIIEEHFAEQLRRLDYDPQTAQVRIPVAIAARWYGWAVGEPTKTAAASKRLHQMANEGQGKRIAPDSTRTYGRCFIWTGPAADVVGRSIANDLAERIARMMDSRDA